MLFTRRFGILSLFQKKQNNRNTLKMQMNQTMHSSDTSAMQKIYDLSDLIFHEALRDSSTLNKIGNYLTFFTVLLSIAAMIMTYCLLIVPEPSEQPPLSLLILSYTPAISTASLAHVFKKQRTFLAKYIIKLTLYSIALFCAAISLSFIYKAPEAAMPTIAIALVSKRIYKEIQSPINNTILFNNKAPTHKQLLYIKECRKNGIFNINHLPPSRTPRKSDILIQLLGLLGTALFFALSYFIIIHPQL